MGVAGQTGHSACGAVARFNAPPRAAARLINNNIIGYLRCSAAASLLFACAAICAPSSAVSCALCMAYAVPLPRSPGISARTSALSAITYAPCTHRAVRLVCSGSRLRRSPQFSHSLRLCALRGLLDGWILVAALAASVVFCIRTSRAVFPPRFCACTLHCRSLHLPLAPPRSPQRLVFMARLRVLPVPLSRRLLDGVCCSRYVVIFLCRSSIVSLRTLRFTFTLPLIHVARAGCLFTCCLDPRSTPHIPLNLRLPSFRFGLFRRLLQDVSSFCSRVALAFLNAAPLRVIWIAIIFAVAVLAAISVTLHAVTPFYVFLHGAAPGFSTLATSCITRAASSSHAVHRYRGSLPRFFTCSASRAFHYAALLSRWFAGLVLHFHAAFYGSRCCGFHSAHLLPLHRIAFVGSTHAPLLAPCAVFHCVRFGCFGLRRPLHAHARALSAPHNNNGFTALRTAPLRTTPPLSPCYLLSPAHCLTRLSFTIAISRHHCTLSHRTFTTTTLHMYHAGSLVSRGFGSFGCTFLRTL